MKKFFKNDVSRLLTTVAAGALLSFLGIMFAGEDPSVEQFVISLVLLICGASLMFLAIINYKDDEEEKVYKNKDYSKDFEQLTLKYEVIQPPKQKTEQSNL